MVGRALEKGPDSVSADCAEGCLKYLKDGERLLGGSGEYEQKCECIVQGGNDTCDYTSYVIIALKIKPSAEMLMYYRQPALDQRALDIIFESGGESIAP